MKNRNNLINFFGRDRKVLYITLCIVMLLALTLTIAYAALSTTLNIDGNAEVSAASWDIYLDNAQLINGSVGNSISIDDIDITFIFSQK